MDEKKLYEENLLGVTSTPDPGFGNGTTYHLRIGNQNYSLIENHFNRLVRAPRRDLEKIAEEINQNIIPELTRLGLTPDALGVALAQAKVKEYDNEVLEAHVKSIKTGIN